MDTSPGLSTTAAIGALDPPSGAIQKQEVSWGDCIQVRTRNSTYLLSAVDNGYFLVTGGWFDRNRKTPFRTRVTGCTWGGSAILTSVVAAPGLFLEFSEPRVLTTRIQDVQVLPARPH